MSEHQDATGRIELAANGDRTAASPGLPEDMIIVLPVRNLVLFPGVILPVAMKDKAHLYAAYMPYVKSGGLFVATNKRFDLGSEVFLLLTLPDSSEKLGVPGKVVWVTPAGAQVNRSAGVGVQFADGGEGEVARSKIEALIAGLNAEKPTATM